MKVTRLLRGSSSVSGHSPSCPAELRTLGRLLRIVSSFGALAGSVAFAGLAGADATAQSPATNLRSFFAKGVVREVKAADHQVVIAHDAIENYMAAMTMPFNVREPAELAGLRSGDQVSFRLHVTDSASWIEHIARIGTASASSAVPAPARAEAGMPDAGAARDSTAAPASATGPRRPRHPLLDFPFTNELGQRVTLGEFRGQALAITFFFTRCPIPDFCPRLSRNFQEASQKLAALPTAPTNWHFLSVSFDTEFDSPAVLRAYGEHYHYDPKHWSFLTGPADKIRELANLSDVTFEKDNGFYNHNFRTLVIDTAGHLQMSFPIGGDLSDELTKEILKAAAVTNAPP